MTMLDGYAADLERHLSGPDVSAPECECGWTLGTYLDDHDKGGKVLMVAEQACPGCGKYHEERRA